MSGSYWLQPKITRLSCGHTESRLGLCRQYISNTKRLVRWYHLENNACCHALVCMFAAFVPHSAMLCIACHPFCSRNHRELSNLMNGPCRICQRWVPRQANLYSPQPQQEGALLANLRLHWLATCCRCALPPAHQSVTIIHQ